MVADGYVAAKRSGEAIEDRSKRAAGTTASRPPIDHVNFFVA